MKSKTILTLIILGAVLIRLLPALYMGDQVSVLPGIHDQVSYDALARSSKFREVFMPLHEALKIPGLVLSWHRTSSEAGSKYGHTAITWGDGHTSSSDYVESNTTNNGRSGLRIFMPV